jgi:hypothetical protein
MKRVSHHFKLAETPFIADRILHNYKRDRSYFEHYSPVFNNEFLVNFEKKVDKMVHFFRLQSLETEIAKSNVKKPCLFSYVAPLIGITEALINRIPYGSAPGKTNFNINELREALKRGSLVEIKKTCQDLLIELELNADKFIDHGILTVILNDFRILIGKLQDIKPELTDNKDQSSLENDEYQLDDNNLEDFMETILQSTSKVFGVNNIDKMEDYSIERIMIQAQFNRSDSQ